MPVFTKKRARHTYRFASQVLILALNIASAVASTTHITAFAVVCTAAVVILEAIEVSLSVRDHQTPSHPLLTVGPTPKPRAMD
jgi:hypothetical protein